MTELKYFKRNRVVEEVPLSSRVLQIQVDDIRPNRAQPRAEFDNNSIIRLADSIRRYGILQPLSVRKSDDDDIYSYELIAGERRLRAAKMLGYFTVPCIVIEADERLSAEMAIIENLLREDLNMFEQAYAFKKLVENHYLTQEEVARRMSMSQSAVANKMRLLKLSYEEQKLVLEAGLTERHARALLKLHTPEQRIEAIKHISSTNMNVINAEHYIENLLKKATEESPKADDININLEDIFAAEKSAISLIDVFRKKINSLNRLGKAASMDVKSDEESVQLLIKIAK